MNKHLKWAIIAIIVAYMITLPLFRSVVYDHLLDNYKSYSQALKIYNDKNMFDYALDTKIGNILAEGTLSAKTPVVYDGKKYIILEKITEEYTRHTRIVTKKVGKRTVTEEEVYYTWDKVDEEIKESREIKFLGKEFKTELFVDLNTEHIETVQEPFNDIRYKYYGYADGQKVTIAANTSSGSLKGISEKKYIDVYRTDVKNILEEKNPNIQLIGYTVIYSIVFLVLIAIAIYGLIEN